MPPVRLLSINKGPAFPSRNAGPLFIWRRIDLTLNNVHSYFLFTTRAVQGKMKENRVIIYFGFCFSLTKRTIYPYRFFPPTFVIFPLFRVSLYHPRLPFFTKSQKIPLLFETILRLFNPISILVPFLTRIIPVYCPAHFHRYFRKFDIQTTHTKNDRFW